MNKLFFFLLILLFCISTKITAQLKQATGSIQGIITDKASGETLAGANIFIKELEKGVVSDTDGKYFLKNIPKGNYSFVFSYIGYDSTTKEIKIDESEEKTVLIQLNPTSQTLNEVVITGKSEARELREQAMPISVISMKDLQGTVSDISDILSKTVGVTIRSSGGVGSASRVSVRGLEGKRIGFFIDDTPMSDQSDFISLNDIPIDMIDRIEVYKGIVPAKLGGSSIGGAINIVTKEYPARYGDFSYSIESFNTHKAQAVFKRSLPEKKYMFGTGAFYTYSDNNYTMKSPFVDDFEIKRDHDKFEKFTFGVSVKKEDAWLDEIELEPIFIRTKKQIQGIETNIQKAENQSNAFILNILLKKNDLFIKGLDFDCSTKCAYTILNFTDTAMHRYRWDMSTYHPVSAYGGEIGVFASNSDDRKLTFINKTNLGYIFNANNTLNFNSLFNFAYGKPKNELRDKSLGYQTNFDTHMNSWVGGLAHEYRTTNDKILNSFTIKYYHYTMQTELVDFMGMNSKKKVGINKSDYGISEAIRIRLRPYLMIKASASYDLRLPVEEELLGDGYIITPSGELLPERNTSFNLGFLFDKTGLSDKNLQIELNFFYMYLKDMIRFTAGPLLAQYTNFGEMRTLGLEAEVKANLFPWLYGYWNACFQDLRDKRRFEPFSQIPNPTKGLRMPNTPYFLSNIGLEFHKENLFGGKKQNSRIYTDASFIEEYFYDFEQSTYQDRRIPRSFSVNLGFEHSFNKGQIFLSGKVNNLTNAAILSEINRPLAGRNLGIKIRYIFK